MSEDEKEQQDKSKWVNRLRSAPVAVKAGVFLVVLVAALLPFFIETRSGALAIPSRASPQPVFL